MQKFVEVVAKGKGMAARSRAYVTPIAVRYVQKHQMHLFDIQAMRRSPGTVTTVPVQMPDTTSTPNDMFNDAEWDLELKDVEVQEIDGTWRNVVLFRNKTDANRVCIWFGEEEYEGIDPSRPYSFDPRSETLEDDEGFDMNWRIVGVDNDSSSEDDDE